MLYPWILLKASFASHGLPCILQISNYCSMHALAAIADPVLILHQRYSRLSQHLVANHHRLSHVCLRQNEAGIEGWGKIQRTSSDREIEDEFSNQPFILHTFPPVNPLPFIFHPSCLLQSFAFPFPLWVSTFFGAFQSPTAVTSNALLAFAFLSRANHNFFLISFISAPSHFTQCLAACLLFAFVLFIPIIHSPVPFLWILSPLLLTPFFLCCSFSLCHFLFFSVSVFLFIPFTQVFFFSSSERYSSLLASICLNVHSCKWWRQKTKGQVHETKNVRKWRWQWHNRVKVHADVQLWWTYIRLRRTSVTCFCWQNRPLAVM